MGRQTGPHYITGTIGDRTYYKLNGQYLVRAKSTLSRRRVKRSPAFRRTMEYAEWLGQASKVAAEVYRMMPRDKRKVKVYRKMTGKAMEMVKQGVDEPKVKEWLMREYLRKTPEVVCISPVATPQRRQRPVVVRKRKIVPLFCTGQRMVRRKKGLRVTEKRGIRRGRVCKRE